MQDVRLVGTLALILGIVLFVLTAFATLILLIASTSGATSGDFIRGTLAVMLALVMAATMAGLGGQMQHVRTGFAHELENLRLVWTSLVMMMVLCGAAAIFLVAPLFPLAVVMLLALFAVRGAVIRLTS